MDLREVKIKAAADFLAWLAARDTDLAHTRQADIDAWLVTSTRACHARDFLTWAAERRQCSAFDIPAPERTAGTA
jgi:hypothetical protein